MKNILFLTCAAVLSLSACSSPTNLPAGHYSKTQKSTDARGTEVEKTTNTNVYYDENGNKRAVQEMETSRDPKGLFNKSTSSSTRTYN